MVEAEEEFMVEFGEFMAELGFLGVFGEVVVNFDDFLCKSFVVLVLVVLQLLH